MTCPECGSGDDGVVKVRDAGHYIYRRRECHDCGARWSTYERRRKPGPDGVKVTPPDPTDESP